MSYSIVDPNMACSEGETERGREGRNVLVRFKHKSSIIYYSSHRMALRPPLHLPSSILCKAKEINPPATATRTTKTAA